MIRIKETQGKVTQFATSFAHGQSFISHYYYAFMVTGRWEEKEKKRWQKELELINQQHFHLHLTVSQIL